MKIIDLSHVIDNECMTCGTPWHEKVRIERLGKLSEVGRNTSRFVLGSHSATHMDAPLHFLEGKHGIDGLDLNVCVGPVTCIDVRSFGQGAVVEKKDLEGIQVTERMLFVFGWNKRWKTPEFYKGFPYFSEEAIEYLLERGMKLIAMDTPSPDDGSGIQKQGENDSPNHIKLLSKDVIIVEYLTNTEQIDFSKSYDIAALPLKIKDADGAPARVILTER
jgi:arylformamidase